MSKCVIVHHINIIVCVIVHMSIQEGVESSDQRKDITVKILRSQHREIEKIVEASHSFLNVSDFIRDALREKIQRWNTQ